MRAAWAAVLLLWAGAAQATQDGWPALYDVAGVSADDRLNVRAGPSVATPILGTLAADAENIEVIAATDDLRWGRVNTGEQSGWVALRFMARQGGQWDGRVPPITRCFGTEPFWTVERTEEALTLAQLGAASERFVAQPPVGSTTRRDRHAFTGQGETARLTMVVAGGQCSDGMSDRLYGLSTDLVLETEAGLSLLSGCCTIAPN